MTGSAVKTCKEDGQWVERTDYSHCVDKQASIRFYEKVQCRSW